MKLKQRILQNGSTSALYMEHVRLKEKKLTLSIVVKMRSLYRQLTTESTTFAAELGIVLVGAVISPDNEFAVGEESIVSAIRM